MSHTNEHPRMVKPKRKQANGNHKDLGMCGKSLLVCAGWLIVDAPSKLRKGDKLCPDCSDALSALYERNAGAPTQRGNWR